MLFEMLRDRDFLSSGIAKPSASCKNKLMKCIAASFLTVNCNLVFCLFQLFHACDQEVFSFCLMKYSVLQFCDSYTATLTFWVTVLAMGGPPEQIKSLLQVSRINKAASQ